MRFGRSAAERREVLLRFSGREIGTEMTIMAKDWSALLIHISSVYEGAHSGGANSKQSNVKPGATVHPTRVHAPRLLQLARLLPGQSLEDVDREKFQNRAKTRWSDDHPAKWKARAALQRTNARLQPRQYGASVKTRWQLKESRWQSTLGVHPFRLHRGRFRDSGRPRDGALGQGGE